MSCLVGGQRKVVSCGSSIVVIFKPAAFVYAVRPKQPISNCVSHAWPKTGVQAAIEVTKSLCG
jgi:hypothetical protein